MNAVSTLAPVPVTAAGLDTANLSIDDIIGHRVFARDATKVPKPPVLASALMNLPAQGSDALQQRLTASLGSRSHGLEMSIDKTDANSFFQLAAHAIGQDKAGFITSSQEMAKKLASAQANTSGLSGVLLVIRGRVGKHPRRFIAVIKAEVHDGFAAGEADKAVDVAYLTSLMLTPTQRLYKVGLLLELASGPAKAAGTHEAGGYQAFLFDHLITATETRSAAAYFYAHFLGMDIQKSSRKMTQEFFEHTETFIKTCALDEDDKWALREALRVNLRSASTVISVGDFAEAHIADEEVRDAYCDYLEKRGFPKSAVSKDVAYVKAKLRRPRKLSFSTGVKVLIPADADQNVVTVAEQTATSTTLVISGSFLDQE
ncbi:nucleoid-associated protein [Luteibacter sp. E-22]|uniref:nucleoid-associated protein n=1 Tax=Luteibacter sp. E-22 TaxID=3404050 RepID=UPI003CEDFB3F